MPSVDIKPECSMQTKQTKEDSNCFAMSTHIRLYLENDDMYASCDEIFSIQVCGLAKRLVHTHCKCAVIGISGGLDSTLALLVCVKTFDKLGYDRKGHCGCYDARLRNNRSYIQQCHDAYEGFGHHYT